MLKFIPEILSRYFAQPHSLRRTQIADTSERQYQREMPTLDGPTRASNHVAKSYRLWRQESTRLRYYNKVEAEEKSAIVARPVPASGAG